MPELPEVRCVARSIRGVLGRVVQDVRLGRSDWIRGLNSPEQVVGRSIGAIRTHGKRIWLRLDGSGAVGPGGLRGGGGCGRCWLLVHLGMTGRLELVDPWAVCSPHTHAVLVLEGVAGRVELRSVDPRRFGGLWLMGRRSEAGRIGPDALRMSAVGLAGCLAGSRRAVKAVLLDQSRVAGLGNIYVDESLHGAGIHPLEPACNVDAEGAARLHRSIRRVLLRAVRLGGSTLRDYRDAGGVGGMAQRVHRVYGRGGEPCMGCGAVLACGVVGGRTTCWCAQCQRLGAWSAVLVEAQAGRSGPQGG